VVDLGPRAVLCLTRWISATVTLFHRRVLVRLLGLLVAAINLLRVAGLSSVFGLVDFGWILVLRSH
jgi:hypothetical protein